MGEFGPWGGGGGREVMSVLHPDCGGCYITEFIKPQAYTL